MYTFKEVSSYDLNHFHKMLQIWDGETIHKSSKNFMYNGSLMNLIYLFIYLFKHMCLKHILLCSYFKLKEMKTELVTF